MTGKHEATTLTDWEKAEIDRANASGLVPVVFVHGLWLLSSSWQRWRELFEGNGYTTLAPGWPDDPATVEEAKAHPEVFAHKMVQAVTDHYLAAISRLQKKPVVIGHSFGGLIVQKIAGEGVAAVTVAIDNAPFKGVLPLTESHELYESFHVPASGAPLFQAAVANFNPFGGETHVDLKNADRGPLLIIAGDSDNTVPLAITEASYKIQSKNPGITEIERIKGRGHSLVIDHGWNEVADAALAFVKRFV